MHERLGLVPPDLAIALREVGWDPGRVVETSSWVEQLNNAGWRVTAAGVSVLQSLGGLTILGADHQSYTFDPSRMLRRFSRGWLDDYIQRLNEDVMPVGFMSNGPLLLLVTVSGRLVGGFDGELVDYGAPVWTGIARLVSGHPLAEVP